MSQMLPVQRFGVTIDQCTGCGGVFLTAANSSSSPKPRLSSTQPHNNPQPPPAGYPPQQYAAQPGYVENTRPRGFLGGLFGEGYYGGRHGGYRGGHH
nr:zf-TFIIB domain-containing protein [Mycobacterium timonense]